MTTTRHAVTRPGRIFPLIGGSGGETRTLNLRINSPSRRVLQHADMSPDVRRRTGRDTSGLRRSRFKIGRLLARFLGA